MAKEKEPKSNMVKFRLNHECHRKDCEGSAGDVIDVLPEVAADMAARGGGDIIQDTIAVEPAKEQ